jgi:hypothetical protein
MKLIGVIAVLLVLSVGCQKEDIRPNASNPATELRTTPAPDPNASSVTGGVTDENTSGSGAITDPNDANRSNKSPKPKQ